MKVKSLSRVRLFVTPWTAAYQAPPSMGFSGQQYWSGVPLPSRIPSALEGKVLTTEPLGEVPTLRFTLGVLHFMDLDKCLKDMYPLL